MANPCRICPASESVATLYVCNNVLQYFGLDAPAGSTSLSVADGYFVMLAPLSAGKHTIHFAGIILFTQAQDGFDELFELDITYHLKVQ
jgi:hypothetical protein